MEVKEFTSEKDRLEQAIASGEVTAFIPLADELNDQGHPYAEELSLCAFLICDLESQSRVAVAMSLFKQLQMQQQKTDEGDSLISQLSQLME